MSPYLGEVTAVRAGLPIPTTVPVCAPYTQPMNNTDMIFPPPPTPPPMFTTPKTNHDP